MSCSLGSDCECPHSIRAALVKRKASSNGPGGAVTGFSVERDEIALLGVDADEDSPLGKIMGIGTSNISMSVMDSGYTKGEEVQDETVLEAAVELEQEAVGEQDGRGADSG